MREKTDSFAFEIKKAEQLSKDLQPIYRDALERYGALHQAIYTPPLTDLSAEGDEPYLNGCVLMIFDERVFIGSESVGNQADSFEIPFEDIIYLETGTILLHSWFKLVFGTNDSRSVKIPFNTVGEDLFREAIRLIREKLDRNFEDDFEPEILTQSDFPLKFLNALPDWFVENEKPIGYAFQPEIRVSHLFASDEQIAPPLLAILTNREFLLIAEEPKASAGERLNEYGEIYTYCPYSNLRRAEVRIRQSGERELADFGVTLANRNALLTITFIIAAESAPQFKRLSELVIERFKEVAE